ncbi:hypothetical protein BIW11_10803 [Tropilaelaps mercedesae]|uniref:Uncharacterized protein n=1 Tax=Tropilaelaps mercedesae TaxID=418985 RepID=A0A1V9XDZ5_9ACAR|nr:hypothetical protein BIW11_10803 [Tropilaelaps mercedesae]
MGKKIPTKKHNKLKAVDPFNRTANSNILKSKDELRNFAPKKLSQDAPGSLRKLFSCDDTDESSKRKRKKKTDRITVRTLNYRDDTASLVSQDTYETDDQFLKRVSQMANRARERADISVKFDVRFNEDGTFEHEVTDASTLPTRKKRRLLEFKEKQKAKMRLKELHGANAVEQGQAREFPGRDRFRFGEVVHAPPEITAKLRGNSGLT